MRTLNYMTEAKNKEKKHKKHLIFMLLLAHRLGISKIRTEMEDLLILNI